MYSTLLRLLTFVLCILPISAQTPWTSFCLGDGTGAACPCGNTGSSGNGCANSTFAAGGHLAASGTAGASAGKSIF